MHQINHSSAHILKTHQPGLRTTADAEVMETSDKIDYAANEIRVSCYDEQKQDE